MGIHIGIDVKSNAKELVLPVLNQTPIELEIKPISQTLVIGVSDFPSFIKIAPNGNMGLVKDNIGINILSQRLVIDSDPLTVTDIDIMSLGDLDISQNKTIYNI